MLSHLRGTLFTKLSTMKQKHRVAAIYAMQDILSSGLGASMLSHLPNLEILQVSCASKRDANTDSQTSSRQEAQCSRLCTRVWMLFNTELLTSFAKHPIVRQ